MLRNVCVYLSVYYSVPSAVLIYFHIYTSDYHNSWEGCVEQCPPRRRQPSHSKSVSKLWPAIRAGAGGVLKGFRRLEPKDVLVTECKVMKRRTFLLQLQMGTSQTCPDAWVRGSRCNMPSATIVVCKASEDIRKVWVLQCFICRYPPLGIIRQ